MAETAAQLGERAAALLGARARRIEALQSGGLSLVARIALEDGRIVVAKTGPDPALEAQMLTAIRASGAPAPAPLAHDAAVLVMAALEEGPGAAPDAELGEAVKRLHADHGRRYGWPSDFAFGAVPIRNAPGQDWPAFWAERRLLSEAERLPPDLARRLETLAARLPEILPGRPAPSLLHGDLWSGNILAAGGRLTGLIDPACYRGHGEVDLAMLHLFGAPGPAFWDAYGALEPGWPQRRAVYQLWPAIVHIRLYGPSYRSMVERLLDQATG